MSATNAVSVNYVDNLQGLFVIRITDLTSVQKLIPEGQDSVELPITVKYTKRGLAGIPTFMDWDGVVGSVKVLLQK